MHLVDRHRRAARIARGAGRHPVGVAPAESVVSHTTDAVEGRSSAPKPTGSALSGSNVPSAPTISYLYSVPSASAGTKISQTPVPTRFPHGVTGGRPRH
jgi:hypothetical protein